MPKYRRLKGMRDLYGDDLAKLKRVEKAVRELFRLYGYEEIVTPTLESYELIAARSGEEIRLRMYAFEDLGGRKVVLRPDMTSPIARFVASEMKSALLPIRLGYVANVFRYDNPQRARYREFWQAGFELIGSSDPSADAEILDIAAELMERLGLKPFAVKLGHVGIIYGLLDEASVEKREQFKLAFLLDKGRLEEAKRLLDSLGVEKGVRETFERLFELKGKDPSRILQEGRRVLSESERALSCLENLEAILDLVSHRELDVLLDLGFARGLEYYTGMIFEVYVPQLDVAVGGGGRYDGLIALFGGKDLPAVGYSAGMDRLALVLPSEGGSVPPDILVAPVGGGFRRIALEVARQLRDRGLRAEVEVCGRRLSKALSYASRKGIPYVVIVGREWERRAVVLRDMIQQKQVEVPLKDLLQVSRTEDLSRFFLAN